MGVHRAPAGSRRAEENRKYRPTTLPETLNRKAERGVLLKRGAASVRRWSRTRPPATRVPEQTWAQPQNPLPEIRLREKRQCQILRKRGWQGGSREQDSIKHD